MRKMGDKINGSNFIVVNGAGHMVPIEKASSVNEKIAGFLRRINLQFNLLQKQV